MRVAGRRNHLVVAALLLSVLMSQTVVASAHVSGPHRLKRSMASDHVPSSGRPSTLVADNFTVLGHSNLGGGSPHGDVAFFDPPH